MKFWLTCCYFVTHIYKWMKRVQQCDVLLAISASTQGFYVGSKTHLRSCDDYFLVCVYPLIFYVRAFLLGSFFVVPCKTRTLFFVATGFFSSDPFCIGILLLGLVLLFSIFFQLWHEQILWIMSQVYQSFSHCMDPLGGPIVKDKDSTHQDFISTYGLVESLYQN